MANNPPSYEMGHSPSVTESHASRTVHSDAAFLLPHLRPTMHILDVGCGPGTITTGFLPFVPQGSVVGIDYSEDVIHQARKLAADGSDRLEFKVGNLMTGLPFADDSFDVIFASQVFPHMRQPTVALAEMRRVCKPGGMVATRDGDAFHWYPNTPGLELWVKGMVAMTGVEFPGRRMHVYAKEVGFDEDKMTVSAGATCIADRKGRKWWGELHARRLEESDMGRKMVEGGMSNEEVGAMKEALREWAVTEDGWYALLQSECIFRK